MAAGEKIFASITGSIGVSMIPNFSHLREKGGFVESISKGKYADLPYLKPLSKENIIRSSREILGVYSTS